MDSVEEHVWSSRLIFATVLFILSLASVAFIPLVLWLPISDAAKTTISALLVAGVPQGLNILAVIILGKEGYQYLKSLVFGFIKKNVKFREVGPIRIVDYKSKGKINKRIYVELQP